MLLWYLRHLRLRWEGVCCVTDSPTFLRNDTHVHWELIRILIHTRFSAITSTCFSNKFKHTAIEICITKSVNSGRAPRVLPPSAEQWDPEATEQKQPSPTHIHSSPPPPWTVAQLHQHFRFFPRKKNVLTSRMRSCDGSSVMFLQEISFTLSSSKQHP